MKLQACIVKFLQISTVEGPPHSAVFFHITTAEAAAATVAVASKVILRVNCQKTAVKLCSFYSHTKTAAFQKSVLRRVPRMLTLRGTAPTDSVSIRGTT